MHTMSLISRTSHAVLASVLDSLRRWAPVAGTHGRRSFASAATESTDHTGLVELREYTLKPEGIKTFVALTASSCALRLQLLPFLGMFSCDTGGALNRVLHLYHYADFDARDSARAAAAGNSEWQDDYLPRSRQCVSSQESSIYRPAVAVLEAAGAAPLQRYRSPSRGSPGGPPPVYELRQYQLHPGYGSVPKLLEAFAKGVPDKILADPQGELVHFAYTDVGVLNSVLELWRYPSAQACMRARQAAREVPAWRAAIAAVTPGVQQFRSSFLHPLPFSPMQ